MNAADFIDASADLAGLREAARSCTGCRLYRDATQTVFGEGAPGADLMLVGEQPGDAEDRTGLPFVGPAGKPLERALEEAGIRRDRTYLTNAARHRLRRCHRRTGAPRHGLPRDP